MIAAGAVHFVVPQAYDPLIPPTLGPPRPWVGSGVAEIGAGALLAASGTRRAEAWAVAAVLLVIARQRTDGARRRIRACTALPVIPFVAWLRVPFQVHTRDRSRTEQSTYRSRLTETV